MRHALTFVLLSLAVPGFWLWADGIPEFSFGDVVKRFRVSATSTLREKRKPVDFYSAARATDRKLATAWCAGKKGGIGDALTMRFKPTFADGILLFNGYGATRRLYYANNRIRRVEFTITYRNGRKRTLRRTLSAHMCGKTNHECDENERASEEEKRRCRRGERKANRLCHFVDTQRSDDGMGRVNVPLRFKPACIIGIRAKILSVRRGRKYNDSCIAELSPVQSNDIFMGRHKQARKKCR